MSDEYRKILMTGNRAQAQGINNAAIKFVNIIRAKFLDDIRFFDVGEETDWKAIIPNDIDDFDVTTEAIVKQIANGKNPQQILDYMKFPQDKDSPFKWQRSIEEGYPKKFLAFVLSLKTKITAELAKAKDSGMDAFTTQDIKSVCVIENLGMDMGFNNELTMTISMKKLNEISPPPLISFFIPRENDMVEIGLTASNGQTYTAFSGLITGVSLNKEYGALASISVVAHGISKVLVMNQVITDRAVVTQFEGGELAQTGLTPWSNYFANQTVDRIFQFLMTNEMGMQLIFDYAGNRGKTLAALEIEAQELITYEERIKTEAVRQGAPLLKADKEAIAQYLDQADFKPDKNDPKKKVSRLVAAEQSESLLPLPFDPETEAKKFDEEYLNTRPRVTGTYDSNQLWYARYILLSRKISGRLDEIRKQAARMRAEAEKKPPTATETFDLDFRFYQPSFSSAALFQMTYLPLVTLALYKIILGQRVARFTGKQAAAFDLLLKTSFNMFFSQMQSPAQVLETVKKTAKFAIYENEIGEIVAELPRYNEFLASTSENIKDFIIYNPLGAMQVMRQDINLITRIDAKQFIPVAGYQEYTMTSRQFTDIAVLAKYGMRPTDPKYNPNATSPEAAQLYAALEVAMTNANTRTITLNHTADRQFKLGRLYFIAANDLETVGGNPEGQAVTDGYVGYLVSFKINIQYGDVISYALNFNYVRKAKLVIEYNDKGEEVITANFKILPDLGGLIDVVEEAEKKGTLNKTYAHKTPSGPQIERPANTISTQDNGDIYTIKRLCEFNPYNNRGFNNRAFAVAPDLLDKLSLLQTKHRGIPDTEYPNYHITDLFQTNCAPVITQQDIQGGAITRDVIWMLYLIDCRIRAHNINLYNSYITELSALHRQNEMDMSAATASFMGLYIPNHFINEWYHLTTFMRLNIESVLSPVSGIVTNVGLITKFGTGEVKLDTLKIRLIGNPILFNEDAPHFCILMVDDAPPPPRPAKTALMQIYNIYEALKSGKNTERIRLAGNLGAYEGVMWSFNQVKNGKETLRMAIVGDKKIEGPDKDKLQAEIDFAISQIQALSSATTAHIYLPVIIRGPIAQDVVKNVFPGYAFTLMDIAGLCPYLLPGNFPPQTKGAQRSYDEHVKGRAVDISLSPFYAKTGLALKKNARAYHPFQNGPMLSPVDDSYVLNVKDGRGVKHGQTSYDNGTKIFDIVPNISQMPNSQSLTRTTFETALRGKTLTNYFSFNPITELSPEDRIWHHVSGNPEFNIINKDGTIQDYKAEVVWSKFDFTSSPEQKGAKDLLPPRRF